MTKKGGTNIETKFLEGRHMSRPFSFPLACSISKLVFLNVCGLPFNYRRNRSIHLTIYSHPYKFVPMCRWM
jgi:hypothetical protein